MPRAFSEQERAVIRTHLRSVARNAFGTRGLRRTSVEDLARGAGISKGAFYLFYRSKEALFIDLLEQIEIGLRERFLREVVAMPKDSLRRLLTTALSLREIEPMLERLALEDAAHLLRGLSAEQAQELLSQDVAFVSTVLEHLDRAGARFAIESPVLTGLLRALFFVSLHREQIGADVYQTVVDLLVESLAGTLTEEA